MLKQLILVRHGESEEDVNPTIRSHIVDSRISLTLAGRKQVTRLANALSSQIRLHKNVRLIASTTNRAVQTTQLFCSQFPDQNFEVVSEDRIRSLNWGNVDESTIRQVEYQRYQVGVLYFQFPEGDDTKVFVGGIKNFVDELREAGKVVSYPECVVVFTHGFALRVVAKEAIRMSDEGFRYLANPPNCYTSSLSFDGEEFFLEEPLPQINFKI